MTATTPMMYSVEPARQIRAASYDFGYDHEVQIALPRSYAEGDRTYPVLWVVDGGLYFHLAASIANLLALTGKGPEFIVIAVGHAAASSEATFGTRRLLDFFPMQSLTVDSLGDVEMWDYMQGGHAAEFLSFLVDELRPGLEKEFRMRPNAHTVAGCSGGAYFSTYAMFTRPEAFQGYLLASPPYDLGRSAIFDLEADYARENSDLAARVFFIGGDREVFEPYIGQLGIIASMVRMASTLDLRKYPSLNVACQIVDGQAHTSIAIDLFKYGIENLWGRDESVTGLSPEDDVEV